MRKPFTNRPPKSPSWIVTAAVTALLGTAPFATVWRGFRGLFS